ncbi:CobT-like cobalamin biosynthesis protein [Gordonia phage Camerico]|nr:CobT-like cobalamin biosynthesis protein [Gordonia phage Camerico]
MSLFDSSYELTEPEQIAYRATQEFMRLAPQLTRYARALSKATTGKENGVTVTIGKNTYTNGKKIFIRPPMELANYAEHDTKLCEQRDETGALTCPACHKWEDLYASLYHEISHCINGSFNKIEMTASHRDSLEKMLDACAYPELKDYVLGEYSKCVYISPRHYIDNDLLLTDRIYPGSSHMNQAVEDIRVDYLAAEARPGTGEMKFWSQYQTLNRGILMTDGSVVKWKDSPEQLQASVAVLFMASGQEFTDQLSKRVIEIANALDELGMVRIPESKEEVFILSIALCAAINSLSNGELFPVPGITPPAPSAPPAESGESADDTESAEPGDAEPGESSAESDSAEPEGDSGTQGTGESGESQSAPEGDDDAESADNTESDSSESGDNATDSDDITESNSEESGGGESGNSAAEDFDEDFGDNDSSGGSTGNMDQDDSTGEMGGGAGFSPDPNESSEPANSPDPNEGDSENQASSNQAENSAGEGDSSNQTENSAGGEHEPGENSLSSLESQTVNENETAPAVELTEQQIMEALNQALGHDNDSHDPINYIGNQGGHEMKREIDRAMDKATMQAEDFDSFSRDVGKLNVITGNKGPGYSANAGSRVDTGDKAPIASALLKARKVFGDSKLDKYQRNQKAGRLATGKLYKVTTGSDKVFQKKLRAEGVDFEVVIGLDVSGSTSGPPIGKIKSIGYYTAELLHKVGVEFSLYAHTTSGFGSFWSEGLDQSMHEIKAPRRPWNDASVDKLQSLCAGNGSLDGHNFEFYRKILDKSSAKKKLIIYFTDGSIPETNHEEEVVILNRELELCRANGYAVLAVGVNTDSPKKYGLDTVLVRSGTDVKKVIDEVEKRLVKIK